MRKVLLALALSLVAVLVAAAPALAAPKSPEIDVQLWPGVQPGQAVVIVGTTIAENAKLPVTVKLPVVAGMTVDWAGEIGGESASDVQREYRLKQGVGGQYAEFEVSQSRQAQIELSGIALTSSGDSLSAAVDWVQTVPADVTAFSVRVPAGAKRVVIDPAPAAAPQANESGESLYTLPSKALGEGARQRLSVSYSLGSAQKPPGADAPSSTRFVLGLLIGLLALAVAALALLLSRRRGA